MQSLLLNLGAIAVALLPWPASHQLESGARFPLKLGNNHLDGAVRLLPASSRSCSKDLALRDVRCYPGADAFVQIQNCLNALPPTGGTCDATAIQGPQTVANVLNITHPATILFGDTVYTYTGRSVLISVNARGVQLVGKGRGFDSGGNHRLGGTFGGRTQFVLSANNASRHLVATDADNLTVQDISFIGPGINASSGGGISNTISQNRNLESLVYRNVEVSDVTNTAISVKTPISSVFDNVLVRNGASDGIDFFNGGTTVTCMQCFALTMAGRGIVFDGITSVLASGGAAESCGIGWDITNSNNVVLDAPDAEAQVDRSLANPGQVGHAYRINDSTRVTLVSPNSRAVPSAAARHFLITGGSTNVRIIAPRILEGRRTPAYDIEIGSGSSGIKLDGLDPSYTVSDNGTGTIVEDMNGKISASNLSVTGSIEINGHKITAEQQAARQAQQQSIFNGVYAGGAANGSIGIVSETVLARPVAIKRLDYTIAIGGLVAPACSSAQPSVSIYDQSNAASLGVPGIQIAGPITLAPGARSGTSGNLDITLSGGHIFQLVYSAGTGCPSQPTQVNIAAYYTSNT